jgi:hypothetical protein
MDFSLVFHRSNDFQEKMNQVRHQLSTYFFIAAVVRVCLSTHTLGIIASKSGSSVTVPRAEFREGGVQNPSSEREFETQVLVGPPTGGTEE